MGVSKTELFTDFHNQVAKMAKALGHPARVAIMEYLIKKNSCVCGDIVEELPLSQSTVSQHLKALKDAKLIKGETDGPYTCFCIDQETCSGLMRSLREMMKGCC